MQNDDFFPFYIESPDEFLNHTNGLESTNHEVASLFQNPSNEGNDKCQKLKPRRKRKEIANTDLSNSSFYGCKIKVLYGGYFRSIKNVAKKKYCSGKQKTLYLDPVTSNFDELFKEITELYNWEENHELSLYFLKKDENCQSYIQLQDDNSYQAMLSLHQADNYIEIYVITNNNQGPLSDAQEEGADVMEVSEVGDGDGMNYEEGSDYCASEESYHSLYSSDDDASRDGFEHEEEFYSFDKDKPVMEVGAKYPDVTSFRRALNHYDLTENFEFDLQKSDPTRVTAKCLEKECKWRIHAAVSGDHETFMVKSLQLDHTCYGVNKRGNKHATEGWIADRVINDLRKEGGISTTTLKRNLETKFGITLPYLMVWWGKELTMEEIHGKWDEYFIQFGAFKEEILRRNPGSIVVLETEPLNSKKGKGKRNDQSIESRHFQRFFISLGACRAGFLNGCRPYIGLDACHLKGKWNGVLTAAIAIDENNMMFPVAFTVMENESAISWEWFLKSLHKAIGMPDGLVISSDMQKGLLEAISKVYPTAEHRECMRHLYKNFKKYYSGDVLKAALWAAARTYSPNRYQSIISAVEEVCPEAIKFLKDEHYKLWSRSQFETAAKCDYITNNISETFNSWVGDERKKPVLDLLDSIRQKIMVKFNERRRCARSWKGPLVPKVQEYIRYISRGVGEYTVQWSTDHCAEVQYNEKRWEVNLEERKCTCRAWQVRGVPCVHAAALIASIRNPKWEDYVDSYFTVDRFKTAYAVGIPPMPSKNEWPSCDLGYIMIPPILKRPSGRPKKNRIKAADEKKKKRHNKCSRCGRIGHHKNTCKNAVSFEQDEGTSSVIQPTQKTTNRRGKKKINAGAKKWTSTSKLLKLLQERDM